MHTVNAFQQNYHILGIHGILYTWQYIPDTTMYLPQPFVSYLYYDKCMHCPSTDSITTEIERETLVILTIIFNKKDILSLQLKQTGCLLHKLKLGSGCTGEEPANQKISCPLYFQKSLAPPTCNVRFYSVPLSRFYSNPILWPQRMGTQRMGPQPWHICHGKRNKVQLQYLTFHKMSSTYNSYKTCLAISC